MKKLKNFRIKMVFIKYGAKCEGHYTLKGCIKAHGIRKTVKAILNGGGYFI